MLEQSRTSRTVVAARRKDTKTVCPKASTWSFAERSHSGLCTLKVERRSPLVRPPVAKLLRRGHPSCRARSRSPRRLTATTEDLGSRTSPLSSLTLPRRDRTIAGDRVSFYDSSPRSSVVNNPSLNVQNLGSSPRGRRGRNVQGKNDLGRRGFETPVGIRATVRRKPAERRSSLDLEEDVWQLVTTRAISIFCLIKYWICNKLLDYCRQVFRLTLHPFFYNRFLNFRN